MKTVLGSVAEKLRKAECRGYIRRVMWLSFEDRLRAVFAEIDSKGNDAIELGNFYLSFSKTSYPAYSQSYVYRLGLTQAGFS